MTNELTVVNQSAVMPVMDIQQAKQRRNAIVEFVQGLMVDGQHYGKIPGTTKNTLLKPGAEMLTTFFGLSPRFEIVEKDLDWTGKDHDGEPFFYFQYRCSLWRGDLLTGEGVGSCNSWEKKYRWRKGQLVCPECGEEAVIKGKAQYGGGWLCWGKKGGCGYKFLDNDERITGQETGQVPNDNPADLVNTLDKMAQKRALVAATLIAVNASEFFTQDVEDMDLSVIDGDYTEIAQNKAQKTSQQKTGDVQTLNEYENRVYTSKPNVFFIAASDWIGCTEDEAKEAMRQLGHDKLDKEPMGRVKQLRQLHNAMLPPPPEQEPLFGDDGTAVTDGAYAE